MSKPRVCVIGAGISGMSTLFHFAKLTDAPDIVCYDKQPIWGGLWNFSWRTGTDEYGEVCHSGMYRNLWSNSPKECLEFPDYTFEEHFGRNVPSYPPREALRDYQEGRWTRKAACDLKQFIRFNTVVQHVKYNSEADDFTVTVKDLKNNTSIEESFSHVVVAVGIFNAPKVEYIEGIDTFTGRVMHSHNFRDAREFKGQRILLIGSKYSAEDLAMQCMKYGAKNVTISWRTKPMGFTWPAGIEERQSVQRFNGNNAYFKDGSSVEVDVVIYCSGYLYSFPFMDENLRLKSGLSLYPDSLYKGVLWLNGGNKNVFYVGAIDQYYSYTMFDIQALWTSLYISGRILKDPISLGVMKADVDKWHNEEKTLDGYKDDIAFQSRYMDDMCHMTGYQLDTKMAEEEFLQWEQDKKDDVATFRDKSFKCIFTKSQAPLLRTPWMKIMDTSLDWFLKNIA